MCDGAHALDGAGFNAADTKYGKVLAERAMQRPLTDAEVYIAKRMCRKYHRQLPEELFGTLWMLDEALGNEGSMLDVMP